MGKGAMLKEKYGELNFLKIMEDNIRTLDEEEMMILTNLLFSDKEKLLQEDKDLQVDDPLSGLFQARLEGAKLPFKVTNNSILFCRISFVESPGNLIILLRILYEVKKNIPAIRTFDIKTLAQVVFPCGVPTKEGLSKMWESQKFHDPNVTGDNLLDIKEYWE